MRWWQELCPGAPGRDDGGNDQGKVWVYQDELFANAPKASPEQLKAYAEEVGLDVPAFKQCVNSGTHYAAVQRDAEETPERLAQGDFGCQPQGPDTGGLAKSPWTLVQQGAQLFAAVGVEDGMRVRYGADGPRRKTLRSRVVKAWIVLRTV